jgi:hypothetical protein
MTTTFTTGDKPTIDKDPNAILDYVWDWSAWLAVVGDAIASHTITINDGVANSLTLNSSTNTAGTVTAWLSGGTVGEKVKVTCRITTSNATPRVDDRSVYIKIRER